MENSINETKKEEEISVIAKRYENVALAIIGIENQTNIDYLMPIRCMLYDAISYTKQGDALKAQYKEKRKERKDNVFPNMTKAEYTTDAAGGTTSITITDAKGHTSVEVRDAAGLLRSAADHGDNAQEYTRKARSLPSVDSGLISRA